LIKLVLFTKHTFWFLDTTTEVVVFLYNLIIVTHKNCGTDMGLEIVSYFELIFKIYTNQRFSNLTFVQIWLI